MGDERLYQQVKNELEGKPRKYTDRALMTKAEVLSEGDETKKIFKYIQLRVEQLKEKEREKARKITIKEKEKAEKIRIKEREISNEEEDLKIANSNYWIFWIALLLAFLAASRLGGLLGFVSVMAGYYAFFIQRKERKSFLFSMLSGFGVSLICYFLGVAALSLYLAW
tara:strand:- start:185 stop:688 length:504 start_codon:yes stop_codon:yes gene_type:complete